MRSAVTAGDRRFARAMIALATRELALAAALACTVLAACSGSRDSSAPAADACSPDAFDRVLQKYVIAGKVDYASLKASKADLQSFDDYLKRIATCDAGKLAGLARSAFWVNAYNAFNIKGVLDNWPLENIKSVNGFLDKKQYRVANLDL